MGLNIPGVPQSRYRRFANQPVDNVYFVKLCFSGGFAVLYDSSEKLLIVCGVSVDLYHFALPHVVVPPALSHSTPFNYNCRYH